MLCSAVYAKIPTQFLTSSSAFPTVRVFRFSYHQHLTLPHVSHLTPLSPMVSELFPHFSLAGSPVSLLESVASRHFSTSTEGVGRDENVAKVRTVDSAGFNQTSGTGDARPCLHPSVLDLRRLST